MDAIEMVARARLIDASADLELQIEKDAKHRPVIIILAKARSEAMKAMKALVMVDCQQADTIRILQNEIRRYDDLVAWVNEIIQDGKEADRQISEEEQADIGMLLNSAEGRAEARELGLEQEGYDD